MKLWKVITPLLLIGILAFFGYQWYDKHNQKEEVLMILNEFRTEHPEVSLPQDFDLKKGKQWDTGAVQYELQKSGKNYHVLLENQEVVRIFTKYPEKQIYPLELKEMNKGEYALTVSKLLGDTLLNIKKTEDLSNSPELFLENQGNPEVTHEIVLDLDKTVQDSIQLYEEFKAIVPPVEWEALHNDLLALWNDYIIGEKGLVNQVENAWNNSEEERQILMDVAKEKSVVAGEYGIELGDLILRFLGEITGISQ